MVRVPVSLQSCINDLHKYLGTFDYISSLFEREYLGSDIVRHDRAKVTKLCKAMLRTLICCCMACILHDLDWVYTYIWI